MQVKTGVLLGVLLAALCLGRPMAHTEDHNPPTAHEGAAPAHGETVRSVPGHNAWNMGREPEDWWQEIVRYHGHMGPWNVLGWRIGKAAMRELDAEWGDHSLDIICHLPLATPYTCLADGLMVATGNSLGRLDLRLSEELTTGTLHISVRRKTGGPVLVFHPDLAFVEIIETNPVSKLEALSRQCAEMKEKALWRVEKK